MQTFASFFLLVAIRFLFPLEKSLLCVNGEVIHGKYLPRTNTQDCQDYGKLCQPDEYISQDGLLHAVLKVTIARFKNSFLSFGTRSYNGKIPGPTIRVFPGDRIVIQFVNELESDYEEPPNNTYPFRKANTTNIHTHGLHISPSNNADNIFLSVHPGENFTYQFDIPKDHPSGTFWYHAHHHGSLNSQLVGMMAGALIIEDVYPRIPELDSMEENILLLQAICLKNCAFWANDLVPGIQNYRENFDGNTFDPQFQQHAPLPLGKESLLHVLINGQYNPKLTIQQEQLTRLRFIQGLPNDLVEITLPGCEMYILARDGIYRDRYRKIDVAVIPPGGRTDIAVRCMKAGIYELKNDQSKERDAILGYGGPVFRAPSQTIATFHVGEQYVCMNLPSILPRRPAYMRDLTHVNASQVNHHEVEMTFYALAKGEILNEGVSFKKFNKSDIGKVMKLNQVQEWKLVEKIENNCLNNTFPLGTPCPRQYQNNISHPVHIHVNHFQIIDIDQTKDKDFISTEIGEWRDTIPVFNQTITVRFIPHRFTGKSMMHCHISKHSDAGMMEIFEIVKE